MLSEILLGSGLGSTFARNQVLVHIAHKLQLFGKVFWLGSTLVPLGVTGPSMHWRSGSPIFQELCMENCFLQTGLPLAPV